MTSRKPAIGEVWLAYVEFNDHPGVGKVRPVVVVDVREQTCTVIAAKVTSKDLRVSGLSECIPIIGWDKVGLRKPSFVRLDQKLELAFERLLRDEPLGILPKALFDVIAMALSSLGDSAV